jgi:hypothetical protein
MRYMIFSLEAADHSVNLLAGSRECWSIPFNISLCFRIKIMNFRVFSNAKLRVAVAIFKFQGTDVLKANSSMHSYYHITALSKSI